MASASSSSAAGFGGRLGAVCRISPRRRGRASLVKVPRAPRARRAEGAPPKVGKVETVGPYQLHSAPTARTARLAVVNVTTLGRGRGRKSRADVLCRSSGCRPPVPDRRVGPGAGSETRSKVDPATCGDKQAGKFCHRRCRRPTPEKLKLILHAFFPRPPSPRGQPMRCPSETALHFEYSTRQACLRLRAIPSGSGARHSSVLIS